MIKQKHQNDVLLMSTLTITIIHIYTYTYKLLTYSSTTNILTIFNSVGYDYPDDILRP